MAISLGYPPQNTASGWVWTWENDAPDFLAIWSVGGLTYLKVPSIRDDPHGTFLWVFFGSKKSTRTAARNILTPWWYWRKQVLSYWLRNRCWQRLKRHVEFLATSMASCGISCCSLQPLASREVRKIPRMMMRFLFFIDLEYIFCWLAQLGVWK